MLKKTKRKNKASIYGNKALDAQESSNSIFCGSNHNRDRVQFGETQTVRAGEWTPCPRTAVCEQPWEEALGTGLGQRNKRDAGAAQRAAGGASVNAVTFVHRTRAPFQKSEGGT